MTNVTKTWAKRLPPAQREFVESLESTAIILAGQLSTTPLMIASVLEKLAPGYGETLARLLKRADLLEQTHQQFVSERSIAPRNVNNGGFGGI